MSEPSNHKADRDATTRRVDARAVDDNAARGAIFVFGSNLAGRHGKGAALDARRHHGAIYGRGEGMQGHSYAIPTKDAALRILPIDAIRVHVARFLDFAASHPELTFAVTPIGCGLAGYSPAQIAPLFRGTPCNCKLPPAFVEVLAAGDATPAAV